MIYDKDTVRLPRQGIPFCLRPLILLDFRRFRAGCWDTFGTVDRRDIAYGAGEISQAERCTGIFILCL